MHNICLYTKSYRNDVLRSKKLKESIEMYNVDNIPYYISVPSSDINLFKNTLGEGDYILIPDEEIVSYNDGWVGQQVVKSQFWKLELCKNYVCIDSDCFFIKDFKISDFMKNDIPYTIRHEYKYFFLELKRYGMSDDVYGGFVNERKFIMDIFDRSNGIVYDFGPGPTIWSCDVWKSLEEKYILPNNLTFSDLIVQNPSEFSWYGEWLMYDETIPILPRDPLFRNYHYPQQLIHDKKSGITVEDLRMLYLGIGMQSNFQNNGEY